ncbi:ABC transporter ATP-binding protein [Micromonospora sonneratiae]|uniref:ATP-binding cassette domain-containing protein n=1 Tax=Micromonospora sonneratiae TaxID=1184706 RepID=A0ABW3YBB1_9ACTN
MNSTSVRRVTIGALRDAGGSLGRLAVWSVVEALPALLIGYATARALDDGFLAGRPATGLAWLGLLAVAVGFGAVGAGRAYACLGDVVEPFRDELVRRVVGGALDRSTSSGARPDTAAVARLTHQVEIVRDTFAGLVMVVRGFLFAAGSALLGLLALAPVVTVLVVAPLVAALALFAATLPAMVAHHRAYVRADERLGESASNALTGHRDVVACGGQERVASGVGGHIDGQADAERALARMAALRSLTLSLGGWLPLGLLLLAAPWLVRQGLTAGAVLGALLYVCTGLQPALHTLVRGIAGGGLRFVVTLDRVLRASTPPTDDGPTHDRPTHDEPTHDRPTGRSAPATVTTRTAVTSRPAWAVELRSVTFRYGPHARPVLDDLDLTLSHGDHLAVVGPSGAGKSTLAAVLAGLLHPQHGTVRLAGAPVTGDPTLPRRRVLIPQEAYVFSGRLVDNLRYLCPSVDEAAIGFAIDVLGLRPLVDRLGGPTAPVDPSNLSAGQRQLISVVRAYLSPAPLAILDEATCHLDPAAEATVESAFAARSGTLVVVAHRISSALRAQRVLVIDGGRPALGTHEDLLDRSATYRDLVGHWQTGPVVRSDPTRVASDPHRLDPGTRTRLAGDPGQVVAYRPGR